MLDVKAAAKVLTGYKIDNKTLTVSFDASRHDDSDKQFSAFYANTIIKGNAAGTAQVASQIFDDGTNVGIGTTSPYSRPTTRRCWASAGELSPPGGSG